jgi:hypothetical protein
LRRHTFAHRSLMSDQIPFHQLAAGDGRLCDHAAL